MRPKSPSSIFSSVQSENPTVDTLERLKSISRLTDDQWLDLLNISWYGYQKHKMGLNPISEKSIDNLAYHFGLNPQSIVNNQINFDALELKTTGLKPQISDRFMIGAYSRRRTTITTMEFIEKSYGWRVKSDLMRHFGFNQAALSDPFASISLSLLTEICNYLSQRQFQSQDFFLMGAYSAQGNSNSILSQELAQFTDLHDLYYHFIYHMMVLFECNFLYTYDKLSEYEGVIGMKSNPDVANEIGVTCLGNPQICVIKQGMSASIPSYIGLPYANVTHTTCQHKGDDACRFNIDFRPSLKKN